MVEHSGPKPGALRAIGMYKLLKGVLLLIVGFGVLRFLHRDVAQAFHDWLEHWEFDPDTRYFRAIASQLTHLDSHHVALLSAGTLFYATVLFIEGVGLLLMKRWAEMFTVIVTSAFIPLEIYHLVRHFSATKVVVILLNAAIVAYLIWCLKKQRRAR